MRKAIGIIIEIKNRIGRSNYGLHNIEAIVWVPVFLLLITVGVNSVLIDSKESKLLRVVQNANNLLVIGELNSESETEDYIIAELADFSQGLVVESVIDQGLIVTTLRVPAADVMPTGLTDGLYSGTLISISAQQALNR